VFEVTAAVFLVIITKGEKS